MENKYKISVIIPTYNRHKELDLCLQSIINQSFLPYEVIIINNGKEKLDGLLRLWAEKFSKLHIDFTYRINTIENSLTLAKSIGIDLSNGDLISFLDDDLILDTDYYLEIVRVYQQNPSSKGVQGYNQDIVYHQKKDINENFLERYKKFFQISSFMSEKGCKMLPTICVTYPFPNFSDIQQCEWMSGASTYDRKILLEIKPDIALKKYSWNEDGDLSYRVYKKYPGTLYITPFAKYWHKGSDSGRLTSIELIYMSEVYDLYLFKKNITRSYKNTLNYLISRFGRLLLSVMKDIKKANSISIILMINRTFAFFYCIWNYNKITKGNILFFNNWLMNDNKEKR